MFQWIMRYLGYIRTGVWVWTLVSTSAIGVAIGAYLARLPTVIVVVLALGAGVLVLIGVETARKLRGTRYRKAVAALERRLRVAADPSPRRVRGYRLHTAASISGTVGATWFIAWLVSDAIGPQWLHSLSLPAALLFIVIGAGLAGYAGWVGGP